MGLFFPEPLRDAQEIYVNTSDGVRIACNHYKRGHGTLVVLVHGWMMSKDSAVFRAMGSELAKNYDVAAIDLRGHGRSSGHFHFTTHEEKDVAAIVECFRPQYSQVYLIGFSLGAALVILHAAKVKNVDKIIAVSAPTDFKKVENQWFKPEAWVPTLQKGELWRAFGVRVGNLFARKPAAIDFVNAVAPCPILLMAGAKDPTIFPWHAQAHYDAAAEPKHIEIFEHSEHAEDLWRNEPEKFMKVVRQWLG